MSRSISMVIITLALIASAQASDNWPARAVGKNARAFATGGNEKACANVGNIVGATPWCLAIFHRDPNRCEVIQDPQAKTMCKEDAIGYLSVSTVAASAAMVSSDSISNDPIKVKLCAERAKGTSTSFVIDSNYVEMSRRMHPDSTFIAIDGISPQLIECYLREGTGKFEPASMSPEQAYWHLPRPPQFEPGINTQEGRAMAAKVCLDTAPAKIGRLNFDHSALLFVNEVPRGSSIHYVGVKADDYDIEVAGR